MCAIRDLTAHFQKQPRQSELCRMVTLPSCARSRKITAEKLPWWSCCTVHRLFFKLTLSHLGSKAPELQLNGAYYFLNFSFPRSGMNLDPQILRWHGQNLEQCSGKIWLITILPPSAELCVESCEGKITPQGKKKFKIYLTSDWIMENYAN